MDVDKLTSLYSDYLLASTGLATNTGLSAVLTIDDSIASKPYTSKNELVCWHYDHSEGRVVKGINFVSALIHTQQASLPVAMELAGKDQWVEDEKTGRTKRRSSATKNELFRWMVSACERNMAIDYVLADSWYCSAANIKHLARKGLDWIMAIKSNRKIALSEQDKQNRMVINIRSLDLEPGSEVSECLAERPRPTAGTD